MYFLTLSFKKNDPKFEKTWDHRIPVWNGSYALHKTEIVYEDLAKSRKLETP